LQVLQDGSTLTKTANLPATDAAWVEPAYRKLAFGVIPAYRHFELRQARYLDMVPSIQALAHDRGPLRILDIGAGTGSAKQFLDHAGVAADWTGIEIDPQRATICRRLGYQNILDQHDLEQQQLPFEDHSFDVVIASHILEHLVDDAAALADWYRLLTPGGRLLIGVPMHLGWVASLARYRYRKRGRHSFGHCQFYGIKCLERLLADYPVATTRGFRLFSARKWLPFEDFHWFFRASIKFGQRWPGLTQEVNVEILKEE
jgi:SAM-dependent methyltransferase